MTAPLPPDPADVLTRLEELHKAASKGPWGLVGGTHDRDVIDDHGCHVAATGIFPDAAAIVAEHNAFAALLAAVRGVLALAEEYRELSERTDLADDHRATCRTVATRLRAAVAAALGETGGGQ